ncbi:toll/interleukin-1 receptor domain-containing protein [Sodalis sp. RH21]|uniref:toll/interleukin-1 receptor domain-containing protein n=1 Tax=unclassified Sodalis (in: enterobacteria) TaxID=2636512 RepID=UPI0039B3FD40
MPSRIFISHSSRDRDMAYRMIADLEKRGIPCWISSRDIEPGDDYQKSIVDALDASPAMVLLFSDHANNSKEIPREMAIASDKNKPVIPVRIEDVVPKHALAYSLTNAQFLDLFANFDETMNRLADKLQRQIVASELQLGQPPFSGRPDIAGGPAGVTPPPRVKPSAAKPRPVEPATPQTASQAVGSRKKVYAGLGAVVLLAAVGGAALTFKSRDDAPPTAHQTTTSPIAPPAAPTPKAPAPQAAPVAENSAGPVAAKPVAETKTDDSLGALVDRVRQLSPGDRVNALQSSPLLDSGKLSPAQLTSGLKGDDLASILRGTGDSWYSGVVLLAPHLAPGQDTNSVTTLLGATSGNTRARAVEALAGVLPEKLTVEDGLKILNGTGDSRLSAAQLLAPHLPHLSQNDVDAITAGMGNTQRRTFLATAGH